MFLNKIFLFSLKKGGYPVTISYIILPNVHQSAGFPCPFYCNISGAKYSGVPHKDLASFPFIMFILDKPKSVNFM